MKYSDGIATFVSVLFISSLLVSYLVLCRSIFMTKGGSFIVWFILKYVSIVSDITEGKLSHMKSSRKYFSKYFQNNCPMLQYYFPILHIWDDIFVWMVINQEYF